MLTVRWLLCVFLFGLALYVCSCNVALVYRWVFRAERGSLLLLIGELSGMAGLLALPLAASHRWFWIPIIADLAAPYLAGSAFAVAKRIGR